LEARFQKHFGYSSHRPKLLPNCLEIVQQLPGPLREILLGGAKTDTGPPSFCCLRRNLHRLFVCVSEYR